MIDLDENYRIYVPPPPSSGILVAFIMKIMRGIIISIPRQLKHFYLKNDL